ncbi:hypothetical protein ATY77_03090 [Rhizobium sp. R634]|nr:hypothetical protein ATY77_03090 [Rhizobium sp. R634]
MLFAALLLPFSSAARLTALTSSHNFERSRLSSAAESVNAYAAIKLTSDLLWANSITRGASADGMSCRTKDLTLTLRIVNHAGLIDLNVAGVSTIAAGMTALAMSEQQAAAVAGSIVAFRSPQAGSAGASGPEPDFGFKHAPFEDIVELLDFAEMRRFTPEQLGEVFTVDSHSAFVARSFAPKPLQPILAKLDGAAREGPNTLRAYTLVTKISRRGESAIDARIVTTGDMRGSGRRTPSLPLSPSANAALPECGNVLGADMAAWLAETFP